jgi:hypothetical protein
MTIPACAVAPVTSPAAIMSSRDVAVPKTTSGAQPAPHSEIITVR